MRKTLYRAILSKANRKNGADGIGLYRLQQFFIGQTLPASLEEPATETRLRPFKGYAVCVRLLDVGSDKPLPFIGFLAETNPALGRRGVRLVSRLHYYPLRKPLKQSNSFRKSSAYTKI
ncbi:MAG: hypothetical protein OQJ89_10730 [Kangiellaceae bacterium]|nr:hypothetical protein [Kangiellaceae bacterium]MCW8999472.1 hypothetical protein [Kangiellaceae bacterium]MCW9017431.1 hypothetical protein [Kangiellaceae bacterium]